METRMDNQTEMLFLQEILKHKAVIACKLRNKTIDGQRTEAWTKIKNELFVQSGKTFETSYLQSKWINIQDLKRKLAIQKRQNVREESTC